MKYQSAIALAGALLATNAFAKPMPPAAAGMLPLLLFLFYQDRFY
jgi:hypothetical protein